MSSPTRRVLGRAPGRPSRWWPVLVVAAAAVLLRALVLEPYAIPSGSMSPTLEPGDRVLVLKVGTGEVRRGDVVVFDGRTTFGVVPSEPGTTLPFDLLTWTDDSSTYVKRVVGVGGDRVACCTAGKVTVNGVPLDEPYVHSGDAPSDEPFAVDVPPGRLWFLGDHRSASADSRAHLAAPGGGTVAEKDVVGTVTLRIWPLDRLGAVQRGGSVEAVTAAANASSGTPGAAPDWTGH